ncbi:MAG TPA: SUKH-3 domain-containing protein [Saprospiraceae bacterium]|nr:SUKH-3 domain-containing protein [Saprospiraceae bacterium]
MKDSDKEKILNLLIGKENTKDFESWVFKNSDLESSLGNELYLELISSNYNDMCLLHNLKQIILENFISEEEYYSFKYKSVLQDSGWYPKRRIDVDLSKFEKTDEMQNAFKIIEEFGGLKLNSTDKFDVREITIIDFFETPAYFKNMKEYGLNINLVCFAWVENSYIDILVDKNYNFYQMDNVVSENLYKYIGPNYEQMLKDFLFFDYNENFQKVGNSRKF